MRHLLTPLVLSAAALAALLPAQQVARTAHPQESVQNFNGNLAPFGVFNTGTGAEARTQILVPKHELPSRPALLTGLELTALVGGTVNYAALTIRVMQTNATSLSQVFSLNMIGPAVTVFQATNLQKSFSTTGWTGLTFTQGYQHDGASSLLIEVFKQVTAPPGGSFPFVTMATSSLQVRTDRPQMVYAFGSPGSGAAGSSSAFASADPVSLRLVWSGTPTLRNLGDAGLTSTFNQYAVGGSVTFTVDGQPGELWGLAGANGFLPAAVAIPGLSGALRLNGPVLFANGALGASGSGQQVLAIPNVPALAGGYFAYQAVTVNAATGAISLTNGTDHFVNP